MPTLIHEQNAVMGRANKALAGRVSAIAGGFLDDHSGAFGDKTVVTGNPVRPAVIEAAEVAFAAPAADAPFHLLVFGGSQGAQFFSEAMPPAIAPAAGGAAPRLEDHPAGAPRRRRPPSRPPMPNSASRPRSRRSSATWRDRMATAHLVISRSGASTVSEIAVIGRPALLVPYPHALDHDQAANAAALAAAGGAELHPQSTLSPERLAELIGGADERPGAPRRHGGGAPDPPASRTRRGCSPT